MIQDAHAKTDETRYQAEEVTRLLSVARDISGETLVGAAAKHGEASAVQLLLSHRADPTAADSRGRMALHRAAEGGDLLSTLLVLDRLQLANRYVNVTDFVDNAGESPGTLAAQSGCEEVCGALEVFGDLQLNAEQQYFGQLSGGTFGGLLALVDFTEVSSKERSRAKKVLQEVTTGGALVEHIWPPALECESALGQALGEAFDGLHRAEDLLMNTLWMPTRYTVEAPWKGFAKTLDLRARWQRLRLEAMLQCGESELEEFWQTHINARRMAQLTKTPGSLRQLYLGVLWLYTRESWLPHIIDAIADVLRHLEEEDADPCSVPFPFQELIKSLSPMAQLVQAATCFFRRTGVKHEGVTFRPLALPASGLQQLIDMYLARKDEYERAAVRAKEKQDGESPLALDAGMWFVLSHLSFPTAYASRWDAGKRLVQTNSNVLVAIQTDSRSPSYPEHMSLKGGGDDVIYPAGTLFRLVRLARTTSSDLEPQACPKGSQMQWSVTVIELAATDPRPDAFLLLDKWSGFSQEEVEEFLLAWAEEVSGHVQQRHRLEQASALLHGSKQLHWLRAAATLRSRYAPEGS
ncbi:unnamed protein product [Durusdinium trenchii]